MGKVEQVLINRSVPSGGSPGCGGQCRGRITTKHGFTGATEVSHTTTGIRNFTGTRGALFLIVIFNFITAYFNVGVCEVIQCCNRQARTTDTVRQRRKHVGRVVGTTRYVAPPIARQAGRRGQSGSMASGSSDSRGGEWSGLPSTRMRTTDRHMRPISYRELFYL